MSDTAIDRLLGWPLREAKELLESLDDEDVRFVFSPTAWKEVNVVPGYMRFYGYPVRIDPKAIGVRLETYTEPRGGERNAHDDEHR